METISKIDFLQKVSIAANFSEKYTLLNLKQIMEYRQTVAKDLLHCPEQNVEALTEIFEYCNVQIKLILGL